jgi:hypothetical protein
MVPCASPWEVCNQVTGACEQARLEVTSPDAGVVVGVRSAVPIVARLVHDGGTVNARVPVTTDYDAQTANIPFPGGTTLMAPMTAQRATYKFGWDGGPREDREVEVHGCNASTTCATWQSCTPSLDGGTCVVAVTGLQFVSPDGGVYGPGAGLTVAVAVTMVDGGVFSENVPVVGPSGPAVLTGMGPVKTLVTTTPVVGGAFAWRTAFDGGVSAMGTGVVDAVGPSLTFAPQGPGPYLRDALVRVEVRANEALAGPPEVLLAGSDAGVRYVSAAACSGNCGSARCDCVELDMAAPVLPMLTGSFTLSGSARDVVNNAGGGSGGTLAVTRLRWTRDISLNDSSNQIQPVAVSRTGLVITAVQNRPGTSGRVVATWPDGGNAWEAVTAGTVTAGPVVGANDVWVGTNVPATGGFSDTQLQPLSLGMGVAGGRACNLNAVSAASFTGDMALATVMGGEVAIGLRNGRIEAARSGVCEGRTLTGLPGAATAIPSLVVQTPSPASVEAFVASTSASRLWKAQLPDGMSWNGAGEFFAPNGTQVRGLFFAGTGRVGGGGIAGNGNLYVVSATTLLDAGMPVESVPAANSGPPAHGNGFFVWGTSDETLVRAQYNPGTGTPFPTPQSVTLASSVSLQLTTPILGAGGRLYITGENGRLYVRNSANLTAQWEGDVASGLTALSQPALDVYRTSTGAKDCSRPLGVLYVLSRGGSGVSAVATLRAILVDSPGLDNTAPWPKYQRDNGNTGNINSDISPWTCP